MIHEGLNYLQKIVAEVTCKVVKKFSYLGGTTGARRTLCFRTNKELVDSSPTSTSSYDNNMLKISH